MPTDSQQQHTAPLLPVALALALALQRLHAQHGLLVPLVPIAFYTLKLCALRLARVHGAAARERWEAVCAVLALARGAAVLLWWALCVGCGLLDWIFRGYYIMEQEMRMEEQEQLKQREWLLVFDEARGWVEVEAEAGASSPASCSSSPQTKMVLFDPAAAAARLGL